MRTATLLSLLPLAFAAPAKRAEPAPLLKPRGSQLLEGKYIVKLYENSAISALADTMSAFEGDADHIYDIKGFKGFASTLTPENLETLQNHPDVCPTIVSPVMLGILHRHRSSSSNKMLS